MSLNRKYLKSTFLLYFNVNIVLNLPFSFNVQCLLTSFNLYSFIYLNHRYKPSFFKFPSSLDSYRFCFLFFFCFLRKVFFTSFAKNVHTLFCIFSRVREIEKEGKRRSLHLFVSRDLSLDNPVSKCFLSFGFLRLVFALILPFCLKGSFCRLSKRESFFAFAVERKVVENVS